MVAIAVFFYLKGMFFKVAQTVDFSLGNLSEKYVTKNFQKSPNLVTLPIIQVRRTKPD